MTLWILECVLCVAMVGLIWVMLASFGGNHHADDKRQEAVSPAYHYRECISQYCRLSLHRIER